MQGSVREARPEDLAALEEIENAGDSRFVELFRPDVWWPASPGRDRAARPGFLLVAVDERDQVVGFVHLREEAAVAHLEQLSVLPSHGRRGYGRALVQAALDEAVRRGHGEVTLRTYAAVPWNAPFYATLGFEVTAPETEFHRALQEAEADVGLDRYGDRVQMTARLSPR